MTNHPVLVRSFPILLIGFFLLNCSDNENPVGDQSGRGSLSDPSITPSVIFTNPANGATGPFNLFNNGDGQNRAHFVVQFNKLINLASFSPQWMRCNGFDVPVTVSLLNPYPEVTDVFGLRITAGRGFGTSSRYTIGRTYTITIDTSLEDINGNHFPRSYSFSFVPEPALRVVKTSPQNGATGVQVSFSPFSSACYIVFNSLISQHTLDSIRFDPPVQGNWSISSDSTRAAFATDSSLGFTTTYRIIVPAGTGDRDNNVQPQRFESSFLTDDFRILSSAPLEGSDDVPTNSELIFTFSGPVDTSSVRGGLTTVPQADWNVENYLGPNRVRVVPARRLESATPYTLTFADGVRAKDGTPLATPFVFHFTTLALMPTQTVPRHNDRDVWVGRGIAIKFNISLDTTTVHDAFRIVPPTEGSFAFQENSTLLTFIPADMLAADTTHTVTILSTIRGRNNYRMFQDYSFSFRTETFHVYSNYPRDGETNVATWRWMTITFNMPIDSTQLAAVFSMNPPVQGTFSQYMGRDMFAFMPDSLLTPNTSYQVTISTRMRTVRGDTLKAPFIYSFVTAP